MSYKTFVNGFPLSGSELNQYLMSQVIAVFVDSAARTSAIDTPLEGQVTYLTGTNVFQYWSGSAWVDLLPVVPDAPSINNISANYTIQSSDNNKYVVSTGSAVTVTIANVLTAGQRVDFIQDGSGQITFAAGAGVTLQSKGSKLKTAAQESAASVVCVASGQYRLIGDLGA
jgi:hypothetical protein